MCCRRPCRAAIAVPRLLPYNRGNSCPLSRQGRTPWRLRASAVACMGLHRLTAQAYISRRPDAPLASQPSAATRQPVHHAALAAVAPGIAAQRRARGRARTAAGAADRGAPAALHRAAGPGRLRQDRAAERLAPGPAGARLRHGRAGAGTRRQRAPALARPRARLPGGDQPRHHPRGRAAGRPRHRRRSRGARHRGAGARHRRASARSDAGARRRAATGLRARAAAAAMAARLRPAQLPHGARHAHGAAAVAGTPARPGPAAGTGPARPAFHAGGIAALPACPAGRDQRARCAPAARAGRWLGRRPAAVLRALETQEGQRQRHHLCQRLRAGQRAGRRRLRRVFRARSPVAAGARRSRAAGARGRVRTLYRIAVPGAGRTGAGRA
ncbi:hypothetical protein D9M69_249190 [compost metagenome]